MTRRDWEARLPNGVRMQGSDPGGFRLGVSMPVGDDGLWPMRCPLHPIDHIFKIDVAQDDDADPSALHCPYCGHRADDVWAFAPDQQAVMTEAAAAAAEQYVAAAIDDMLGKAFGGLSRSTSGRFGLGVDVTFTPGRPPARRSMPSFEIDETRRTMQCGRCAERFAVYGLAIYCPHCGLLAPAEQLGELVRVQQERLAVLDDLPDGQRRALAESGVLTANYESTIKDGFTAMETYLKARFVLEAPGVSLAGRGALFQRLDDAAALYAEHLHVDLPGLVGTDGWERLLQAAAVRHVLVHNAGIVDAKFLDRLTDATQSLGQRLHVTSTDARHFLTVLAELARGVQPRGP